MICTPLFYDADQGALHGQPLEDLVSVYGSPLYLLDEAQILNQCQTFSALLNDHYPHSQLYYASKANLSLGMAQLIYSTGIGMDVVSGGELFTVLKAGVSPDKIIFHGNNKSYDEINQAVIHGVTIMVDHPLDIVHAKQACDSIKKKAKVVVRIKPGLVADTHQHIQTGQDRSKFGLSFDEALPLIQSIHEDQSLCFLGLHSHLGSQLFDLDLYEKMAQLLLQFVDTLHQQGISCSHLNLGGGFGVPYLPSDSAFDLKTFVARIAKLLNSFCDEKGLQKPRLCFEPGRFLVAQAGLTVYEVGVIKTIPNELTYLCVDGGMADNPRPILYQSEYHFDLIQKKASQQKTTYTIAGKFCESGDILAHDVLLPEAQTGDLLVVFGTGAYNYSMSSNYNRCLKPATVLVNQTGHQALIQRQSYDDLIAHDQPYN